MVKSRVWGSLDPFFEPGDILGRRVANAEFLRALISLDPFDSYHFFISTDLLRETLAQNLRELAPESLASGKFQLLTRLELTRRLHETSYEVFHLSDCISSFSALTRARNAFSREIFPITGTTHSLAYWDYGQNFLKHLWPGVTGREAVVATSRAAVRAVEEFYASLRQGYGLSPDIFKAPRLERIPLGVRTEEFAPWTGDKRLAARQRLGIGPEECAFLCLARLDYFSKMDLLPLFWGFRRAFAAGLAREKVCLVLAGWCEENFEMAGVLKGLAENLGLRFTLIPRPSEAQKLELYAACDAFVSLADNYQETFGLTLLEAASMGLPVLASDFDGYRDLVLPGQSGELIPSTGPQESLRNDILAPLIYDFHTLFNLAQQCAVDVPCLAQNIERLANDSDLRAKFGQAGRAMVREKFTWEKVVLEHLELWQRLGQAPLDDLAELRRAAHPLSVSYSRFFGHYARHSLEPDSRLVWSEFGEAYYRGRYQPPAYAVQDESIDMGALKKLLFFARNPLAAAVLAQRLEPELPAWLSGQAEAHILFALKQDLLRQDPNA